MCVAYRSTENFKSLNDVLNDITSVDFLMFQYKVCKKVQKLQKIWKNYRPKITILANVVMVTIETTYTIYL